MTVIEGTERKAETLLLLPMCFLRIGGFLKLPPNPLILWSGR